MNRGNNMKLDANDKEAIYDILVEGYQTAYDAVDSIAECLLSVNDYREDKRIAELEQENTNLKNNITETVNALMRELTEKDEALIICAARVIDREHDLTELKQVEKRYEEQNVRLIKENASLKEQLKAIKETQSAEVHELKERLDVITDRLKNGIKYDEDLNLYIVVWTKREIEKAKEEAEELNKFFNFPIAP